MNRTELKTHLQSLVDPKTVFIVIFSITITTTFAQSNKSFYLHSALENSPLIKENQNLQTIAELEKERLSKEISSPKVNLTFDYLLAPYFNNNKFTDINPAPQAIGYDINISNGGLYAGLLNVNQPLFTKGVLTAYQAGQTSLQMQYAYAEKLSRHELIKSVTDQYIIVYKDQQLLTANKELLHTIENQQKIVEQLVKAGMFKSNDLLLIALEAQGQLAIIEAIQSQYEQDYLTLKTSCGLTDTTFYTLEAPLFEKPITSEQRSYFLQKYKADSLATEANKAIFETKYKPNVSVFGNTGLNAVQLPNIQRKFGFSVGLSLNIPLYDGHQKTINEQKTQLLLENSQQYKIAKEKELNNNRNQLKTAIASLEKNKKTLQQQLAGYQELFEQYKAAIRQGQLSIINYVSALKIYQKTQFDLINTQTNILLLQNVQQYWNW